jgi:hypothetical protein
MTSLTQRQTFESPHQQAILTDHFESVKYPCPEVPLAYYVVGATKYPEQQRWVYPPFKPTPEAVQRAQFVDKTYKWTGK